MKRNKLLNRKNLIPTIKFLLILNLLSVPLYAAVWLEFSFEPLQEMFAKISADTLTAFGYNLRQEGTVISGFLGNTWANINVSWDSTGWKSAYALVALAIATPRKHLRNKLRFILIGVPTIFVINYARIITTIAAAATFGFSTFDVIHDFLWSAGMISAVLVVWYIWITRPSHRKS